jgi:hypothetical protein
MNIEKYRLNGEDEQQFIDRISANKEYFGSWNEVAKICNAVCPVSHTESWYRKRWKTLCKNDKIGSNPCDAQDTNVDEATDIPYNDTSRKYTVLKKQFQDQRREYNKLVTSEARYNHMLGTLEECAKEMIKRAPLCTYSTDDIVISDTSGEAVLFLADWHYGMVAKNIWNEYNVDICKERVKKLFGKTARALARHKPSKLHIVLLGDMAHGGVHCSARVASEELVCEQLMHVSEIIAETIEGLSRYVSQVQVYSTYGNHNRTIQAKKDSIHEDNMERIVPWWLQQKLRGNERVTVVDQEYNEFVVVPVCGKRILCVHGDLDSIKRLGSMANTLFSKEFGFTIDYTVSADKHHLEEFETLGIENITVPSLCGADDYAKDRRLYSNPSQLLMFFTEEDGRECTYNIQLRSRKN